MKLSCCSWSYHRVMQAKRLSFTEWLRICAEELKVGGVDIIAEQMPSRTKRCWLDTKKRCTDLQLSIAALSPGNNFGKPTAAERRNEVDNIRRWIETAAIMGAPCLRVFAGWPPQGQAERLWGPMVACLRAVGKAGAKAGVTIVVEPHNHGGFLSNSTSILRLMRELNDPWVRVDLDLGKINFIEPDPYRGVDACIPYAPHVVAKVFEPTETGDAKGLDYGRIFALLAARNYRGFITLEYEGEADERQTVPRAMAMLRRLGQAHGLS